MSLYRVTGRRPYRGYSPGEVFVGELEPAIEARAVARKAIEVVESGPITLDPQRATLPLGWGSPDTKEQP